MNISERLQEARLHRGLGILALARRSGVSRATVYRVESAQVNARSSTVAKIVMTLAKVPMSSKQKALMEEIYAPVETPKPVTVDLNKRLKPARMDRSLSVERLARLANVSKTTIYRIEAGIHQARGNTTRKLVNALVMIPKVEKSIGKSVGVYQTPSSS